MKAADWLYDRLPERWKDRVYNNAVNDAVNGIDKASWFRKSEWHADAMGTANQLKDASNLAENRYRDLHNIEKQLEAIPKEPFGQDAKQIMTRGFLAHEAGRLGRLSDSLISALQEQTSSASPRSRIRLVEPEKQRMEGQIEQIERKMPKQESSMSDTYNRKDEEIKSAHRSQTIIKDGADLAQRIRAGQHLEHDQKGYLLEPSRQRVTDEAVSWHRDRAARMSKEIGIDTKVRIAELEKQQQQTRQYVERSVEQIEREQPKQEKQKERSEERER